MMETQNRDIAADSQRGFDVLVIGEINVDLILEGNVVPRFQQIEQIIESADLVMGSSAVIVACGAAGLGLKTAFLGVAGDDLFGHFMLEKMQQKGIDTTNIVVDGSMQTGISVILAGQADRAILTFPGSIPELNISHIDYSLFHRAKHLHLSSYYLLEKLRPDVPELFRKAHEAGMSVSLDTNYDPEEKWSRNLYEALKYVDILMPNETEIKHITGKQNLTEALADLLYAVPLVAVKQGAEGAMAQGKDTAVLRQECIQLEVIDTVGAGDSFDAGFLYAYLHDWGLEESLKMAVVCGSLSTRKAGGTAAQANLDEALVYMKRMQ